MMIRFYLLAIYEDDSFDALASFETYEDAVEYMSLCDYEAVYFKIEKRYIKEVK